MFRRPLSYFQKRFHQKQAQAYIAYRAGLDLVLPWGRRSGKSDLIAELFIEDMENKGKDLMYLALSQKQAREIMWPKFESRLKDSKFWKPNGARLEWRHIQSGGTITLKGTDEGYNRLRGSAKRIIAADEFAFYRKPNELLKEVVRPMLADFNGQMVFCSSPKGKNHFHNLVQRAHREKHRFYSSHCTMFENPFISSEGRDKLVAEYSGSDDPLYRQEVLAEFIDYEGKVFAIPFDTFIEEPWSLADLQHSFHWRGMDHGFSPDPTACTWIAYNSRKGYFHVYQEYKEKALLIEKHSSNIKTLEPYHYVASYSDIDPQVIAEYREVGLDLTPADKRYKEAQLLRLVTALKQGRVKISKHCTRLLEEMQAYEWNQDGEDHLVDAFRYGFNSLEIPTSHKEPSAHELAPLRGDMDGEGYGQDFGD